MNFHGQATKAEDIQNSDVPVPFLDIQLVSLELRKSTEPSPSTALRQYRTTLKSRWNEAEPTRTIFFQAHDSTTAAKKASSLAARSEVVVDTVPL